VRPTLPLLGIILLLTTCKRPEEPRAVASENQSPPVASDKGSNKLTGVWSNFSGFAHGYEVTSTTAVAPDGTYVCTATGLSPRSGGRLHYKQEGTVRIETGFLVQTITNDSQRSGPISVTNRARIIRFSEDELCLDWERTPNDEFYSTNQFVFRRLKE
jgi:hypothetical protein